VPRIPHPLKDVRHVAYCCPSHYNGIPEIILHVTLLGMNNALQMAPQVEVARVREGDSGGHTTYPFSPIRRPGKWMSKYRLTSQEEWAGIPSCSARTVCRSANGTSSSQYGNCSDRHCKQNAADCWGTSS
jgi:hypothetical protein